MDRGEPLIGLNSSVATDSRGRLRLQVPAAYTDAVAAAGGLPLVVPANLPPELLAAHVARCDGFLFIGGDDYPPDWYGEAPHPETRTMHPVRAAADRALADAAWARGLPLFGVCGGLQLLNLARGGRLVQHLPQAGAHTGESSHEVTIRGGRILKSLFGARRIAVNSIHHQAAHPEGLGDGLIATAWADDGTVEALEGTAPGRFVLGVQWHPERIGDADQRHRLFRAFVLAADRGRG